MPHKTTSLYDILGISSATICMVHCIVFPLLSILPIGVFDDAIVDTIFACIAIFVVSRVLMSNATVVVKSILLVSLLIIIWTVVSNLIFKKESPLFLVGGFGMIVGHILNYKNHFKKNFTT